MLSASFSILILVSSYMLTDHRINVFLCCLKVPDVTVKMKIPCLFLSDTVLYRQGKQTDCKLNSNNSIMWNRKRKRKKTPSRKWKCITGNYMQITIPLEDSAKLLSYGNSVNYIDIPVILNCLFCRVVFLCACLHVYVFTVILLLALLYGLYFPSVSDF